MKTIEQVKEYLKQKTIDYNHNIPEQNSQHYRDGMLEIIVDLLDYIDSEDTGNAKI